MLSFRPSNGTFETDEQHESSPQVASDAVGRLRQRLKASRIVGCVVAVTAAAALCGPSYAQAAFEQVPEHFDTHGESEASRAIAINHSGAGGVAPGTFYVVGSNNRVVRFSSGKEGEEPQFEEAWGWAIGSGSGQEYVRCGPAHNGTANPAEHTYEKCNPTNFVEASLEEPGNFANLASVAVDQTTGDVYVRQVTTNANGTGPRQHHLIQVFTAKGEPVGEGFGDSAVGTSSPPESIAQSPEKLHYSISFAAIAVDASGRVYLTDEDYEGVEHHQSRVMSFEPCAPGDYENYCYAAGKDIPAPAIPERMSLVGTDRVVISNSEVIDEYPVENPTETPICTRKAPGVIRSMTSNEITGEVFYFTNHDRTIFRLAPCDEASKVFAQIETIVPVPVATEILSLALNPAQAWGQSRPPGILYGINTEPGTVLGDVFVPARSSVAPTVESESVAGSTSSSTNLEARINPRGNAVSYYFEYLSEADYLANGESFEGPHASMRAPVSAGELASGAASTIAVGVTGLGPETEYRFRVIASSECNGAEQPSCVTTGSTARFASYPTASGVLPDDRAYELVSPIEKHGGEAFPSFPNKYSCDIECKPPGGVALTSVYPMQSTPDGDAVAYMGYPFSPTEGSAVFNSYVSSRSGSDWQTTDMAPALLYAGTYLAYSADLTEAIITQYAPQLSPLAPAGYENLYLQTGPAPNALTPLVTTAPPHGRGAIEYAGHSADFKAQFFSANEVLTRATPYAPEPPDPGASGRDLYEWRDGNLELVNVLPGNAAVAGGATFVSASPDANGVAADGRRVFWAASGHVYVREDGQITRELRHLGTFLSASENGEEVLFSDGCLYSLLTEACTDLTQGKGGFLGIAGSSGDLSRIYFVDKAALTPEAEAGTCAVAAINTQASAEEKEGKVPPGLGCNLYAYEPGVGSTLVATLLASDDSASSEFEDWAGAPGARTAEASSNGRYLAFVSKAPLTGYDNIGRCETNKELGEFPCEEVFLYDSATKSVSCASCNPTGESPHGNSFLPLIQKGGSFPQPRYLTDQGRLFFDSQDRLSPLDVNNRVEDVYEDEPSGAGSCTRTGRCVSLISPGTGSVDSNFLAMGGEGEDEGADVFFTTRERMVPADKDELIDVYDARVEGGFTSEAEAQPAECAGEACQAALSASMSPSAIFGAPASVTFAGAGNLVPAVPVTVAKPRSLTRTQKLTRAFTVCRKRKSKAGRLSCDKDAKRKYGVKAKHAKSTSSKAHRGGK
jgi:hypothetical protein